jgi:hypothetical protein
MNKKELQDNFKHQENLYKTCMENKNRQTKKIADLQAENIKLKTEKDTIISSNKETCKELLKEKVLECEEMKTSLLGGNNNNSKFQRFLRDFENKISGGMIGKMRETFDKKYQRELQNYRNMCNNNKGNGQKGGNPILFLGAAAFKVGLMTLGTFIFSWWPIMMLVSLYCVYVEWKMVKLAGDDILGLPIVYLLGAYLCPCIWALLRLFMGYTTKTDANPKLFNILSKCTDDGFTVNFMEYSGRDCNEEKCLWTTNECYQTLFGKGEGLFDSMVDTAKNTLK